MTRDEFQTQLNRLITNYGARSFSEQRVALLWRSVSPISAMHFEQAVDKVIGTFTMAPSIEKIEEAIRAISQRAAGPRRSYEGYDAPQFSCSYCGGMGYIQARHRESGQLYCFRCDCQAAKVKRHAFPQWSQNSFQEYEPFYNRSTNAPVNPAPVAPTVQNVMAKKAMPLPYKDVDFDEGEDK